MDFDFDPDQAEAAALAERIFTEQAPVDRVRQVEQESGFDTRLWQTLADAGLLGLALPEQDGGAGLGMVGLVALLEQQGRRVAPVPLVPVIVGAALPIARFGTAEQRERWLPGLLDGSVLAVGALESGSGQRAAVRALRDGGTWRLTGEIATVPAAQHAHAFLLPVLVPDGGVRALLVPADRDGLRLTPVDATDHLAAATLLLDGVSASAADELVRGDADVIAWTRTRVLTALAAVAAGVCGEALAMTAAYTSQREQFGRPLSTNQGVAIRAADAYLDALNIRLTALRAASLADEGREEEASVAALVAKVWVCRGGLRVVLATQHLHGGIGADVDFPIHRYFLWGRQLAFSMGTGAAVEAELGDLLAQATLGPSLVTT